MFSLFSFLEGNVGTHVDNPVLRILETIVISDFRIQANRAQRVYREQVVAVYKEPRFLHFYFADEGCRQAISYFQGSQAQVRHVL